MIIHKNYLKGEQIRGFTNYKYSCVDSSPLSVYISHPLWNWAVNFYPKWLAPNVLTLAGWAIMMGCYLFISIIDYDLTSNSPDSNQNRNIPQIAWLLCSVCTFLAHFLDGTDGKQARRTGSSGPTGELFDHGLDSWSTGPFTMTLFSVFGTGIYSVSSISLLLILITVQAVFIVTHWEKYNTGVLFLPWGYDISQYGLALFYLLVYFCGHRSLQFFILDNFNFAQLIMTGFYLVCVLSFVMSVKNIYHSYFVDRTGKQNSLTECLLPLLSPAVLFLVSFLWAIYSPTDVISQDSRVFLWTMCVVFSNIACYLIVAQMSTTRVPLFNKLLGIYILLAFLSTFGLFGSSELFVLQVFAIMLTLAHLHFGVCLVRQLCDHFKIQAFSLNYLKQK